SPPSSPALRHQQRVAALQHLSKQLAGIEVAHDGARRNRKVQVVTGAARFVRTHSVRAPIRSPPVTIGVVQQGGEAGIRAHVDIAATTTVAAIRTAHGHLGLAPEGDAASTTATCAHAHHYSINRKSTRLNSSHVKISYAVFCLKKQ